ncbi:MAG: hypothetical protein IPN93_09210 [Bacteroidetes bacterium]|nr:hypothetical protein [Bacteroidota bacterium]MBK8673151.1 hypothetical protein [Bacteroidota bacterium]
MKKILTILFLAIQFYTFGQDKIILNNKKVIDGKILEVGLNEIKYKPSDNLEGPEYSIAKKEVQLILFSNGKEEIIKNTKNRKEFLDSSFIKYRNSITTDLFSPIYNDFSLAYERRLTNKNIGLKIPLFISVNKDIYFRNRYYDYNYNYIPDEINYSDSTYSRYNNQFNNLKNIGFRSGLQSKFYFSDLKRVNWFISPELIFGFKTEENKNTNIVEKYKILSFDSIVYDDYTIVNPNIDFNNILSSSIFSENHTKINQFNIGLLLSTGFEYRPLPRLSLGGEFGMGYNNVFEKRIYTNKEMQKEYKDKDFDKYFIWRTAFNIGFHF